MTHERLHALTDGIFAIVMTLLVLELKVPLSGHPTDASVWKVIDSQVDIFLGYFISFITLFIYWRAHNFLVTVLAKNIDINLLTLNGVFLFFVGLIPFSTQLAGADHEVPLAVTVYALNILLIGLTIIVMRLYIEKSESIDNIERTEEQRNGALIRTMIPVTFAAVAIPFSFINSTAALYILLFGVVINLYNNTADLTRRLLLNPIKKLLS